MDGRVSASRFSRPGHTAAAALIVGALLGASHAGTADFPGSLESDARAIHDRIFAVDSHVDIPEGFATAELDPGIDGPAQVDLPKMRKGGLDLVFFAAAVGQEVRMPEYYARARARALEMIHAVHRMTDVQYPDEIGLAYSADDAERVRRSGRLVAAIGVENGFAIGKDLSLLHEYYDLGVRYLTLTHIGHNDIADSSNPNPDLGDSEVEHGGLSAFGRTVVAEMNRLGMLVDISHASRAATLDVLRCSRAPVIASHSAIRALADVPRNLDNEQLLAIKANGGVVQIVAYSSYLRPDPPEKAAAIKAVAASMGLATHTDWGRASNPKLAEYGRRLVELDARWPRASVQEFVDHIDYAVSLMGIDHVGIGSDFYAGGGAASGGIAGWMDASEAPNITAELVRRGYSEEDISKIWGGNLMRVWREVEHVAASR